MKGFPDAMLIVPSLRFVGLSHRPRVPEEAHCTECSGSEAEPGGYHVQLEGGTAVSQVSRDYPMKGVVWDV